LNRKLQETLGVEAASDLVGVLESMDASRGDVRELRHEVHEQMTALRHDMELGFARIDARFTELRGEFGIAIEKGHADFGSALERARGDLGTAIEKGLRDQTRFFFLAWAVLLAAFIGLYARN